MGTGILVGGIILLIIGIGAYFYLGSLKTQAEQGLAECQSLLGQAGQVLSQDVSQKCQQAQQYTPAIQAGYYIAIAFALTGLIMAIAGGTELALRATKKGRLAAGISCYKAGYAHGCKDVVNGIIGACPPNNSKEFCRGYEDGQIDDRQRG